MDMVWGPKQLKLAKREVRVMGPSERVLGYSIIHPLRPVPLPSLACGTKSHRAQNQTANNGLMLGRGRESQEPRREGC